MEFYTVPIHPPGDKDDKFILFRPLLGIAFVGNRKMAELTRKILADEDPGADQEQSNQIKPFLQSIGFLEKDPSPPRLPNTGRFTPTHATLLLTNRCNMRCIYCYASGGESPPEDLSLSTAKKAIDIVHENAVEQDKPFFTLGFHGGGEPTVLWDVLVACTDYARSKSLPVKVTLTSNGVWSDEQCTWIIKHIDRISLSMDGHPPVQDRNRPLANGRPSSPILAKTIERLDANQKAYGIRMTAIQAWSDLPKSVEFFYENTQCEGIQVEPAFNSKRGKHTFPSGEQADKFIAAFLSAHAISKTHKRGFRYSAARTRHPVCVFCTAPYSNLTVNPKNEVVACYEITDQDHVLTSLATIGFIDESGLVLFKEKRESLLELLERNREDCRDCFCYWSCAGDCFTRTILKSENGSYSKDRSRCYINRSLTKALLLRKISEGDGVAHLFGKANHTNG